MHYVKVYADSEADAMQALADLNLGGSFFVNGNPYKAVFGYIAIESIADRYHVRGHAKLTVLPAPHSTADVTAHLEATGIQGKTARDIHEAVFKVTNWDVFDPDL
jgi:hypothetical protein